LPFIILFVLLSTIIHVKTLYFLYHTLLYMPIQQNLNVFVLKQILIQMVTVRILTRPCKLKCSW